MMRTKKGMWRDAVDLFERSVLFSPVVVQTVMSAFGYMPTMAEKPKSSHMVMMISVCLLSSVLAIVIAAFVKPENFQWVPFAPRRPKPTGTPQAGA